MSLKDIFRPRWEKSDPQVRRAAIQELQEQELLTRIAKTDNDPDNRRLAVLKLTRSKELVEIAREDAVASVREAAKETLKKRLKKELLAAVKRGEPGDVDDLLQLDADPNTQAHDGKPVLVGALENDGENSCHIVNSLLKAGANPNGDGKWVPLEFATSQFHVAGATVAALINAGASIAVKDGLGEDALMTMAAWDPPSTPGSGVLRAMKKLLEQGVNPNACTTRMKNHSRYSPLYEAVLQMETRSYRDYTRRAIQLLVDAGADARAEIDTHHGVTSPLEVAQKYGRSDVLSLLRMSDESSPQDRGTL